MKSKLRLTAFLSFLATIWFFAHGLMTLSFLADVDTSEAIRLASSRKDQLTAESLFDINVTMSLALTFGALLGFVVSLVFDRRIFNSVWNAVGAYLIYFLLGRTVGHGWSWLKIVFLKPGELFSGAAYYITNGLLMVAFGLLSLLFVVSQRQRGNQTTPSLGPHSA